MGQTIKVNTEDLKPGMRVIGSERQEIMVPPQGLYVEKVEQHKVNGKPTAGILVYWKDAPLSELFNPYWTWYVELQDAADPGRGPKPKTTAEDSLKKMVADLDYHAAKQKWTDDRYRYVRSKFDDFSKTAEWQDAVTKHPKSASLMEEEICKVFFDEFESSTPQPKR